MSQDRPDLKFAAMQVCCVRWPTPHGALTRNVSRGSEDTSLADREQSADSAEQQKCGTGGVFRRATREGDKATRRSVSGGVIMRGGHCLKVWTKKQQVVSLSSAGE